MSETEIKLPDEDMLMFIGNVTEVVDGPEVLGQDEVSSPKENEIFSEAPPTTNLFTIYNHPPLGESNGK